MAEPRRVIDFDHHSRDYARDPVGKMRELRTNCPVAYSEAHGGFWVVTRYDDVKRVAYETDTFSSRHELPNGTSYTGAILPPPPTRFRPIEMDPPEQTRFRRLLNPLFSRGAVEKLRPRI
jgi:cytochrome P450